MKKNPFLFKIVHDQSTNTYETWFTNHDGKWGQAGTYYTFSKNCATLIDVTIVEEINHMIDNGYTFLGIERWKSKKK